MRLTLRTMLAYLDDVLQPADAIELGKRIEESKFASDLVERIRTSTRRQRLGTPKVDGRGIGLDPNSVAEYLDSTLPSERVSDFEKVCLESEVHLAEVACCHQVLTRVMAGEPAPIPPGLRDRMCALGAPDVEARVRQHRRDAHQASTVSADGNGHRAVAAPPLISVTHHTLSAPPVAQSSSEANASVFPWRGLAIALGLTFVVVIGGLRFLGPFDRQHPLASMFGGASDKGREVAKNGANATDEPSAPVDNKEKLVAPAKDGNSDVNAVSDNQDEAIAENNRHLGSARVESADDRVVNGPDDKAEKVAVRSIPANDAEELLKARVAGGDKPAPPAAPALVKTDAAAGVAGGSAAKPKGLDPAGATKATPGGVEPAVEVARLVSEDQVLAGVDPKDGLWYRLTRGTPLVTQETYVVLPFFRPQIVAANAVQAMFVGPATFSLTAPPEGEMGGGVDLQRGRAILSPTGRPGMTFPLGLAGVTGTVVFADSNAELAVEIRRFLPPGADPAVDAARITRLFFARRGAIEWHATGSEPIRIPADHVLAMIDDEEPTIELSAFPSWTEVRNVIKLDRDAHEQLEKFLTHGRPLTLALQERVEFRKSEIRSLAARSLGALGEYDALIRELANEQQHSYWDRAVDDLREALARGPEEAERLNESLNRVRTAEESAKFMRLLRDYSPEQLERQGGAAELVSYLDHKSLDLRVLAFETLRRITGQTLIYRPEAPPERRRVPLQKWRERLKDGQIVYKTAPGPAPVLERKGTAKAADSSK